MEQSTNFGFNLPSRDTDDIVDVNQISDNFRIIDENMVSSEYVNTKILPYSLITKGEKNIFSWDTPDGLYTCPKGKFITFETSEGGKGKVPSDTIFTDSQCLVFVGSNIAEQDYRDKFFTIIGDFLNTDYIFDENGISIHQIIGTYAVRRRINIEASSGYEPEYWFDIPFSQKGKTLTTNDFTDEYKEKLESIPNDIPETDQTYNPESENAQSGKAVFEAIATEIERVNNTFAPVIKNTTSGQLISINDIASPEHTVGVRVNSEAVEDLTLVTVRATGKNLIPYPYSSSSLQNGATTNGITCTINEDNSITLNGTATTSTYPSIAKIFLPVGTYSLSGVVGGGYSTFAIDAYNKLADGTKQYLMDIGKGREDFTIEVPQVINFRVVVNAGTVLNNVTIKPQVETGKKITEYEKYCGATYNPNAEGTVEGVKSIATMMNIFADTEGVKIDCEYNADTKKYIDNKFAELQALVLEG